jgi:putative oxidoreductase
MKNPFTSTNALSTDLAALLLRLIVGGLFIYHGYGKLVAFSQMYANFPDLIGIGGKVSYILVIFAEFFCGILVALGFLTRFSIIPIIITMVVAYFIAHKTDTFQVKELAFAFMTLSVVVFILGSGRISLDRMIFKK